MSEEKQMYICDHANDCPDYCVHRIAHERYYWYNKESQYCTEYNLCSLINKKVRCVKVK